MRRFDGFKARRAAKSPRRTGEACRANAGQYVPVIQARRCEGKGECVVVCPFNVFEVGPIDDAVYRALPLPSRIKLWVHGKQTALTPRADDCQACGLCVAACPERAISLVKRGG